MLTLNQASVEDVPVLLQASKGSDLDERWKRLWVLTPFLARLARSLHGAHALALELKGDMAALQLMLKFIESDHAPAERLILRAHDELLPLVLDKLVSFRDDARRAPLAIALVAAVERRASVLRPALLERLPAAEAEALMARLRADGDDDKQLSAAELRDKLLQQTPRQADAPGDSTAKSAADGGPS